jgi:erythromycin esterase
MDSSACPKPRQRLEYAPCAVLCLLLTTAVPALSQAIDGQWSAAVPFAAATSELVLDLHTDGEHLTGSLSSPYAKLPISQGRVTAEGIAFETSQAGNGGVTIHVRYSGILSADELRLTASIENPPANAAETSETFVLHRRAPGTPIKDPFAEQPASKQVLDWITTHALPLQTVEAGHGFADLEPLKSHIANARVVALGEATHGTREFFQMKHRLLEFLVSEMGFTVFAMEANWPEALAVNDYVLNGNGDPKQALAGLHFWTWYTEETLAMIEWMRQWNSTHDRKVKFYGFDMQFPGVAVKQVLEYLTIVDQDYAASLEPRLAALAAARSVVDYPNASKQVQDQTRAALSELEQRLDEHRRDYAALSSDTDWQMARQHARIAQQSEEKLRLPFAEGSQARDRYMAENARWILDHEPAGTRMVLWAHNGHVAASSYSKDEPMGAHLRRMFGKDLVIVGFAFGEGSFQAREQSGALREFTLGPPPVGTLDATLLETRLPLFVLDLRQEPADEGVRKWLSVPHFSRQIGASFSDDATWHNQPMRVREQFDWLVFVAQTTRARPIQ